MTMYTLKENLRSTGIYAPETTVFVPVKKVGHLLRADLSNWSFSNENTSAFIKLKMQENPNENWTVGIYYLSQIPKIYRPQSTWNW